MLFKDRQDFKDKWIQDMKVKTTITDDKYLSEVFDKSFKVNDIEIYNSVNGSINKVDGMDFVKNLDKSVIVENGAFYKQHNDHLTPLFSVITTNRATRDYNKTLMKKYKSEKNFVKVATHDLKQGNVKRISNILYGTCINRFSKYYNYDIASSITIRGRSTVTVNSLTLESLLGSYRPYRLDIVLSNIENCRKKYIPKEYMEILTHTPTIDELLDHILKRHREGYYGTLILRNRLNELSDEEKKKVYYANNLEALVNTPHMTGLLNYIMETQNDDFHIIKEMVDNNTPNKEAKYKEYIFLDSNNPCPKLKQDIDYFMDVCRKVLFGFFWYEGDINEYGEIKVNTQEIFREVERECILLNDTDSKIFYLGTGQKILENVPGVKDKMSNFIEQMRREVLGTFIIGITDLLIKDGLWRYTSQSNISEEYRGIFKYKQEFYFKTLQPTKGAKNYIAVTTIQEGYYLPIPDIEIKGLPLKKSNFNKMFSSRAQDIVIDDIAKADKLNVKEVLNKILKDRDTLYDSYKEKDNLDIFTVAKLNVSEDEVAHSDHRYKAVKLFNHLYPEETPISIPGVFYVTKIDLKNKEEELEDSFPEIYERLITFAESETKRKSLNKFNNAKNKFLDNEEFEITDDVARLFDYKDDSIFSSKLKMNEYKNEFKLILKETKSNDLKEALKCFSIMEVKVGDINKIALPIDNETVPEFISAFSDTNEIAVYDNLISAIVEGIGILCIKNKAKRNIVHNVVKYF